MARRHVLVDIPLLPEILEVRIPLDNGYIGAPLTIMEKGVLQLLEHKFEGRDATIHFPSSRFPGHISRWTIIPGEAPSFRQNLVIQVHTGRDY